MKINRVALLASLQEASLGLSAKENLEQSNCYVFVGKELITFNDQILVRTENPLGFDAVVLAADLLAILEKLPDDELEINRQKAELVITGNRRTAGITVAAECRLPHDQVPRPAKWAKLIEGTAAMLQQAARTCGQDETQFLTTVVHAGPDRIEACDNYRLFRADGPTGFPAEILIPAAGLGALTKLAMVRVCIGEGWAHFRLGSGAAVSLRCSHEPYHTGIDKLLEITDGEEVSLPTNLDDIIGRATAILDAGYDARIGVMIASGEIAISARKATGWYKERKRVSYAARPLTFDINPEFLREVLKRTTDVVVGNGRMRIEVDNIKVVVALIDKKEDAGGQAPDEPSEPSEPSEPTEPAGPTE